MPIVTSTHLLILFTLGMTGMALSQYKAIRRLYISLSDLDKTALVLVVSAAGCFLCYFLSGAYS